MNYSDSIHIVNVDPFIRVSLTRILEKTDYTLRPYEDAGRFFENVDPNGRGCIVTYVDMPEMIGVEFLKDAKARRVELPIVVITAQATVRGAISGDEGRRVRSVGAAVERGETARVAGTGAHASGRLPRSQNEGQSNSGTAQFSDQSGERCAGGPRRGQAQQGHRA